MSQPVRLRTMLVAAAGMVFVAAALSGQGARVQLASPESAGFSSAGLKTYEQALHALVDEKRLAGVTTLVARHGKVVMFDAYGFKDIVARTPMTSDTIFRLASMTKPIVGVAMMTLWEEGKWKLDDPVHKFIPEFKDLSVKTESGLAPQSKPMTMRQLMSHSAGFDVDSGYADVRLNETDLQGMIDKLAKLPLAAQPGTDWRYGPSVNIQGYIVQKLSGETLDRYLATRIFEPLKMKDTGFSVDAAKLERLTRLHAYGPDKSLGLSASQGPDFSRLPRFLSGSGGLLGTAGDYWRFTQMLLNGGELDGARILKSSTVSLMRTNVLGDGVAVDTYAKPIPGLGFGLDFAVILDPAAFGGPHGKNTFYWGGAFGTWFWIDPTNDVVVIGMIQNVGGSLPTGDTPPMRSLSAKLVYAALK